MPRAAREPLTPQAKLANAWSSVDKALDGTPWTSRNTLPHKLPPDTKDATMVMKVRTAVMLVKGHDEFGVQMHDPPPSAAQMIERWQRLCGYAARASRGAKWSRVGLTAALAQARKDERLGLNAPAPSKTDAELVGDVVRLQTGLTAIQQTVAQVAASVSQLASNARRDERNEQRAHRSHDFHFKSEPESGGHGGASQTAGPSALRR